MTELRYVARDEFGAVVACYVHPQPEAGEGISADHPEVVEFIARLTAPPAFYTLTKLQIIDEMTNAQLEEFYALLAEQPLRLRKAWDECLEVNSGHMFFAILHWEMLQRWGEAEADRILGPR